MIDGPPQMADEPRAGTDAEGEFGKYIVGPNEVEMLSKCFVYHPPKGNQSERYVTLRDNAKDLASKIVRFCPPSRERSLALTKLEESVMWANASIARNE